MFIDCADHQVESVDLVHNVANFVEKAVVLKLRNSVVLAVLKMVHSEGFVVSEMVGTVVL